MKTYKRKSELIDEALIKLGKDSSMTVPIGTYTKLSGQFWVSKEYVRQRAMKLGIKLQSKRGGA